MQKIKEGLEEGTIFLGRKTKEAVDRAKLEMQIMKYKKQIKKQYYYLGQIIYSEKIGNRIDEEEVENICNNISFYTTCLDDLERQKVEEASKETEKELEVEIAVEKFEEDLKPSQDIMPPKRNQEGYLLLKFCPKCQVGNNPEVTRCISCGNVFDS